MPPQPFPLGTYAQAMVALYMCALASEDLDNGGTVVDLLQAWIPKNLELFVQRRGLARPSTSSRGLPCLQHHDLLVIYYHGAKHHYERQRPNNHSGDVRKQDDLKNLELSVTEARDTPLAPSENQPAASA